MKMNQKEIGVKEEEEKHRKKIGTVIQSGDSFLPLVLFAQDKKWVLSFFATC